MKNIFMGLAMVATSSAMAEVTLYGRVSAALQNDQFPSATQIQPANTSVHDYGSYFGIRGSDAVYGQTAAIWQVEQFLNITAGEAYQQTTGSYWVPNHPGSTTPGQPTTGINVLASSDSYIGLQGGWGRVRIGNLSNTFRTNTGAVDIFNGANANVLGTYDRVLSVLAQMIRYDSPRYADFAFAAYYSFNHDGNFNTGGANGNGMDQSGDMNGYNNAPIIGLGLSYSPGFFNLTWNNQLAFNTGIYQVADSRRSTPGGKTDASGKVIDPVHEGINAWVSRLEVSYNNPDSWFLGGGAQLSQGFGYFAVPGNGNFNNLWIIRGATSALNGNYFQCRAQDRWCNLTQAVLSTAEAGVSFGWHIQSWTPKIGYVYGSNMMSGGSPWEILGGKNQLDGTGYQQVVAELDWNITPRTIAFMNVGQVWWGTTAQSMIKGDQPLQATTVSAAGGAIWINNLTTALGFSHTF